MLKAILHLLIVIGCSLPVTPLIWASDTELPKQSFKESIQCANLVPSGKDSEVLPASITREAVIQKLHPAPLSDSDREFERICGILAYELPFQMGNRALLLVYQTYTQNRFGGYDSSDLLVQIGMLTDGVEPRWVAKRQATLKWDGHRYVLKGNEPGPRCQLPGLSIWPMSAPI